MRQKARCHAIHVIFVWLCEFNLPRRGAVCSSRSHGDAWQERTCCSQAPATTEVLKLNTYMGMTGRPFVRALYFQSAKKIIGKKSRM